MLKNSCYSLVSTFLSILASTFLLQSIGRSEDAMASIYKASYVSLHVRKSNRAALSLYRDSLGFSVQDIEKKYCTPSTLLRFVLFTCLRCGWRRCICHAPVIEIVTVTTSLRWRQVGKNIITRHRTITP